MKLKGRIKGQTIVFDEPLGLRDGSAVEVQIQALGEPDSTDSSDSELLSASHDAFEQETDRPQGRAAVVFRSIPAGRNPVTNEMVNELREQLGI